MKLLNKIERNFTDKYFKIYKSISICLFLVVIFLSFQIPKLEKGFTQKIWFKKNDPKITIYDNFQKKFGSDDTLIVAIDFHKTFISPENLSTIYQLTERMQVLPGVSSVESITNYSWIRGNDDDIEISSLVDSKNVDNEILENVRDAIREIKDLEGMFFDKSRHIAILHAKMYKVSNSSDLYVKTMEELELAVDSLKLRDKFDLHFAGTVAMTAGFRKISSRDMSILIPLSLLVLSIMLFFLLGNLKAVFIAIIIVITTILSTMGAQALLNVKISLITLMVPSIIIAIVVSDSIHILSTYLQHRRENPSSKNIEAIYFSVKKNSLPTFLTTVSTFLGFITLTSSSLAPIKDLGVLISTGVLFAWLYSIFFIPLFLTYFPFKSNKIFSITIFNDLRAEKVLSIINKNKVLIIVLTSLITPIAIYLGSKNQVSSNMIKYFDKKVPLRKAAELLNEKAGGVITVQALVRSQKERGVLEPLFLKNVDQFIERIKKIDGVEKVSSIIPILKRSNKVLNGGNQNFYKISKNKKSIAEQLFLYEISVSEGQSLDTLKDPSGRELRLTIQTNKVASNENSKLINALKSTARNFELDILLTGKGVLMQDLDNYILKTFFSSILQAMLLITLFMIFVFKSFKIGLISMLPNILPIIIGSATLDILNIPLDVGTILIVSATLGIAVDDTIFFLNSYFKNITQFPKKSSLQILKNVFHETSNALIITTFTLVTSFGVFIFGSFEPNQSFGAITALILIVALSADLILLPAIILFAKE